MPHARMGDDDAALAVSNGKDTASLTQGVADRDTETPTRGNGFLAVDPTQTIQIRRLALRLRWRNVRLGPHTSPNSGRFIPTYILLAACLGLLTCYRPCTVPQAIGLVIMASRREKEEAEMWQRELDYLGSEGQPPTPTGQTDELGPRTERKVLRDSSAILSRFSSSFPLPRGDVFRCGDTPPPINSLPAGRSPPTGLAAAPGSVAPIERRRRRGCGARLTSSPSRRCVERESISISCSIRSTARCGGTAAKPGVHTDMPSLVYCGARRPARAAISSRCPRLCRRSAPLAPSSPCWGG